MLRPRAPAKRTSKGSSDSDSDDSDGTPAVQLLRPPVEVSSSSSSSSSSRVYGSNSHPAVWAQQQELANKLYASMNLGRAALAAATATRIAATTAIAKLTNLSVPMTMMTSHIEMS